MGFVDLHTHSDASDGSFTPAHLVHLAKEAGLCAIALTDHDTTAGIADAVDAGKELGVEVIPGIEVSGNYEGHEIHILGLFINPDDPELKAFLKDMRSRRNRRNEEMFRRLAADGISFTDEELFGSNPQTVITRAMWPVPWFRRGSVLLRIRPLKNIWNTVAATARPRRRPSRNPL